MAWSAKCELMERTACGPTNERVRLRSVPPIPTSSTCGASTSVIRSINGTEFVSSVHWKFSRMICRAATKAVVDPSMKIASPGSMSSSAASASRFFASTAISIRFENESSWLARPGYTAPPWVRRATPCDSSSSRSRRAVIGEIPNSASRSATEMLPWSRSSREIRRRRSAGSIVLRPPIIRASYPRRSAARSPGHPTGLAAAVKTCRPDPDLDASRRRGRRRCR